MIEAGVVLEERYEIAERLGAGGFACVFEGTDRKFDRPVAIKLLDVHASAGRDESQTETLLARFRREAKLAAQVAHPSIVNVFDYGIIDAGGPVPFMVMEKLEGHDLAEELEEGPVEADWLLPLFVDCLEGLGDAHELGIVHKDIKPSNLFVSRPGTRSESLRIVDFGVAHVKAEAQEERLTATGDYFGTPQYMAPEYIHDSKVSPALDCYQMGLVLVEALSGERVVQTTNPLQAITVQAVGNYELPGWLLDSPLGPVIRRAVATDDRERYGDGHAFADALAEVDPASVPSRGEVDDAEASEAASGQVMAETGGSSRQPASEREAEVATDPGRQARRDDSGWREPAGASGETEPRWAEPGEQEGAASGQNRSADGLDSAAASEKATAGGVLDTRLLAALVGLLALLAGGILAVIFSRPVDEPAESKGRAGSSAATAPAEDAAERPTVTAKAEGVAEEKAGSPRGQNDAGVDTGDQTRADTREAAETGEAEPAEKTAPAGDSEPPDRPESTPANPDQPVKPKAEAAQAAEPVETSTAPSGGPGERADSQEPKKVQEEGEAAGDGSERMKMVP